MYEELIKSLKRCNSKLFCEEEPCCPMIGNREDYECIWILHKEAADSLSSCSKWHDTFADFMASITAITHGKQQYIEQDDGKWYSRISGEHLTTDEMVREYLDEMSHYLD